jgi:hypothetical protein
MQSSAYWHSAKCLFLNVAMLIVENTPFMMSVIKLNVIMLSVVAPRKGYETKKVFLGGKTQH